MSGGVILPDSKEAITGALWGMGVVTVFLLLVFVSLNKFANLPIFWDPAPAHAAGAAH
jgi:hypothetical protein